MIPESAVTPLRDALKDMTRRWRSLAKIFGNEPCRHLCACHICEAEWLLERTANLDITHKTTKEETTKESAR